MQFNKDDFPTSEMPTRAMLTFSSIRLEKETSRSVCIEQDEPLNIIIISISLYILYTLLQMNSNLIKVVDTVKGQILAQTLTTFKICLSHQQLSPLIYPIPINTPISLQTLQYHISNPLSLQNTSLTAGLIQNQIQILMQKQNINCSQVLILDNSNYQSHISQLYDKFTIVKGYTYKIEGNLTQQQKIALLNESHIYKQLQYQFKFGNGKFKPAFIGQLSLIQCLDQSQYVNAFTAYLKYSFETNCPIIVNLYKVGQSQVSYGIAYKKVQKSIISLENQETFKKIESILLKAKVRKANKIIIYNLPLQFQRQISYDNFSQNLSNLTHDWIVKLIQEFDFSVGFDLARYYRSIDALYYIGQLIEKYPMRIIVTSGLRYKTDICNFGGQGFLAYNQSNQINKILRLMAGDQKLQQAFLKNSINLIQWKIRQEEIKIVLMWKCSQCNSEQPQTVQSFRKFGKQFCSIKCLKSHKF